MKNNKSEERIQKEKYYLSISKLLRNNKIDFAKRELIKFINMYPDEEYAIISYVKILIKQGNYDEIITISKRYLDNMKIEYYLAIAYNGKKEYNKSKKLFLDLYKKGMIKSLIQYIVILIKEENFEEAYKYFCEISYEYINNNKVEIDILKRYIYKEKYPELNLIMQEEKLPYFSSQIVFYDEKVLKNILKKRQNLKNEIDIEKLVNYAKDKIENIEPTYFDIFDRYIIEDPGVGIINGKKTNYLVISTNLNTKNIVNIYPFKHKNRISIESKKMEYILH